jgi:hypothetical protein
MKTPTDYLKDFVSCTPQQRASFADIVIQEVNDGHTDPLVVLSAVRNLKDILDTIDAGIKDCVMQELSKHGKSVEMYGMKVEQKEVGTKYNYENSNDRIYDGLRARFRTLDTDIKDREKWLKSIPATGIDIVTEDGEVVKIMPPIKTSTSSFAVTLNK